MLGTVSIRTYNRSYYRHITCTLLGPSGVADISGHMSSHVTGKDGNLSHLTAQLEQQRTEIETLRASKTRCIDVAVTQFQKG